MVWIWAPSSLGFGVQPPTSTWGNLLIGAQNYVYIAPWLALAPGLAITGTLLGVSLLEIGGPAGRLLRLFRVAEEPKPRSGARERNTPRTAQSQNAHAPASCMPVDRPEWETAPQRRVRTEHG
jgi:hypothetical protein